VSDSPFCVVIRADASAQIGLGHVKRSLSLAQALSSLGADVHLLTRHLGVDIRPFASAAGIHIEFLPSPATPFEGDEAIAHSHWAGVPWQEDAGDSIAAIGASKPDWMIVDHYAFDARWHRQVAQTLACSLAVVDDLADRSLDAQIVVDHNYAVDHRAKYAGLIDATTRILGGPRFALLSSAYTGVAQYSFSDEVRSIGIFMGGIDAPDWSSVVLRACREQAGYKGSIEIVTTTANPNLSSLSSLIRRWPSTQLQVDLPDLADFFRRHDLQIGAGGGATWERLRVGAPSLAVACAANQAPIISELARLGAVATVRSSTDMSMLAIGQAVRELIESPNSRQEIAERARTLVDGKGALRVALTLSADRLTLRAAEVDDARLIYEWRNHPVTRVVSGNPAAIEWATHASWLGKVLADPDRILQIATIGALPVGVIRYDSVGGAEAEVSLYLDPNLHGLGLGGAMLQAGEAYVRQRFHKVRRLVATVLVGNLASRRMFEAAGYVSRDERSVVKDLMA
jgi:UDP-2,4-diacetamido-2,4,6-trideoxy-beta-L-altropyranose hydrolase